MPRGVPSNSWSHWRRPTATSSACHLVPIVAPISTQSWFHSVGGLSQRRFLSALPEGASPIPATGLGRLGKIRHLLHGHRRPPMPTSAGSRNPHPASGAFRTRRSDRRDRAACPAPELIALLPLAAAFWRGGRPA